MLAKYEILMWIGTWNNAGNYDLTLHEILYTVCFTKKKSDGVYFYFFVRVVMGIKFKNVEPQYHQSNIFIYYCHLNYFEFRLMANFVLI